MNLHFRHAFARASVLESALTSSIHQTRRCLLDLHGIIQYANGCFLDRLGFTRQEVLHSPCSRYHAELHFRFDDLLSKLAVDEIIIRDVVCVDRKNGSDHSGLSVACSGILRRMCVAYW